jgi:hypothetical protein
VAAFTDPRTHINGVLCAEGSFELDSDIRVYDDHKEYDLVRHILGILESGKELGN